MDDSEAWARATRVANVLMHGNSKTPAAYEPRLSVQAVTRNVVVCDAPLERFSNKRPVFLPPGGEEERWRPIDVLYGSYNPASRTIDIYIDNIYRDASLYGDVNDVLQIVRLHEYAHAVVHLGVNFDRAVDTLEVRGANGSTDWSIFLDDRTHAFEAIDATAHEFLAQAIALAAIARIPDGRRSDRLRATFDAMERRQPPHYVVPEDIKASVQGVDWSLLIAAARRDVDVFRGQDFSLVRGLWALAREVLPTSAEPPLPDHQWIVELDDEMAIAELKASLLAEERRNPSSGDDALELLVDRVGALRIEVLAREHPPPHFRVICGRESANYRIADCHQLNGGLRRQYRSVREWHANNKDKLIDAWNRHRPSDCPVGVYRVT